MAHCWASWTALVALWVSTVLAVTPEPAVKSLDPESVMLGSSLESAGYTMSGSFVQASHQTPITLEDDLGESEEMPESAQDSVLESLADDLSARMKARASRLKSRYGRPARGRSPLSSMYRYRTKIQRILSEVQQQAAHYSSLSPESIAEHPALQDAIQELGVEHMGELGSEGVNMLSSEILAHVMRSPIRAARKLAARAKQVSHGVHKAFQDHKLAAVSPYLAQLATQGDLGESSDLALGKVLSTWSEQDQAGARAVYDTVIRRAERAVVNVRTILINRHIRKFEQMAALAFKNVAKYVGSKWLKSLIADVEQTNLMPKRYITLPVSGEAKGAQYVDKDMSIKLDANGYGYAGGSTGVECGRTCVETGSCKSHPEHCRVNKADDGIILSREVFESSAWKNKNVRYVQASSGVVEGGVSPRAYALHKVSEFKYSYYWFNTCKAPTNKCTKKTLQSWHEAGFDMSDPTVSSLMPQACWYQNMRTLYPTYFGQNEFSQLSMYKWAEHIRNAFGGQTDTGTAILNLKGQPWRITLTKQQYAREGFWNSNTAVGPYIRCGMCKRSKCISRAVASQPFSYHLNGNGDLCSMTEIKSGMCAATESTEYCKQETTAQCLYFRYCNLKDGGCKIPEQQSWEKAGWSEKIYDCAKLVDLSGVIGNNWCQQLVR